ncbi:hypothetical protein [uncultured Microscilla sp.]|uniref:hypothetical protein n=1 Tax=uncultured Microscilla sp. TaxID=432653 RepID=UPI00262065C8|nr:hypothetical protein [uncultured Microscilla sp.]
MSDQPKLINTQQSSQAIAPATSLCICGSNTGCSQCNTVDSPPSRKTEKCNSHIKEEASLDNNTNNCVSEDNTTIQIPPANRVLWNNTYSAKISSKSKQAFNLRRAIANYLAQGAPDLDTGEWIQADIRDLDKSQAKPLFEGTYYERLYNFYYRMGLNESIYAEFDNTLGLKTTQILSTKYSMHNLCPVWGFRRSQIIRKRYRTYFADNPQVLTDYHPCHMVLTLRHNDQGFFLKDEFVAKRFFARELIEQFKQFRDNNRSTWKHYVYGGCYNIEVKKSKNDNGIHVHMHCLILQNKDYKVNEVREWIKTIWERQTGASKVHYETLYFYDHEDQQVVEDINNINEYFDEETGTYEYACDAKTVPTKSYFNASWTPDQTSRAILEALKYNFKPDALMDKNGNFDIEFLAEVLNNCKSLRFHSKFNALYNVKELNFNSLGSNEDELELKDSNDIIMSEYVTRAANEYDLDVEEISEETFIYPGIDYMKATELGYSANYETFIDRLPEVLEFVKQKKARSLLDFIDVDSQYNNMVNPFTLEPANYQDFKLMIGFPHTIRHRQRSHYGGNEPYHDPRNYYQVAQETTSVKELTKSLMMGHFNNIIVYEDYDRFETDIQNLIQLRV